MATKEWEPPLLSMAEAEEQGELSLEEQFSQILYALMRDDVSAAAAIHAFEKASVAMMQQYRYGQAEAELQQQELDQHSTQAFTTNLIS
jgi:hypothetical protein